MTLFLNFHVLIFFRYDSLQKDKEIDAQSSEFYQERKNAGNKKEVILLKEVIKKLENDLMKEKSLHQRQQRKKAQELRELQLEVSLFIPCLCKLFFF